MKKIKKNWERKVFGWSYVFFMIAAFIGWTLYISSITYVPKLEKLNDNLHEQVMKLRSVDRDKCIDLFTNDEI